MNLQKPILKPEIKHHYPSGYYIHIRRGELQPNIIFWTKNDAEIAIQFLRISSLDLLPNYLLSRGIPYQIYSR